MKRWLTCVLFLSYLCSIPIAMALPLHDAKCLAVAMYKEARGEGEHGQIAVAHVVLNRAKQSHKSVCSIVRAKGQFSWFKGNIPNPDKSSFLLAQHLIQQYNDDNLYDFTNGATYFVHKRVKAKWLKNKKIVYKYKQHVFYNDR